MIARRLILIVVILAILGGGVWLLLNRSSKTPSQSTNINLKPATILQVSARFIAPLGSGYLFVDKPSRGLYYATTTATTDLSGKVGLAIDLSQQGIVIGQEPTYNAITSLEPVKEGVVVSTTLGAYLVKADQTVVTFMPPEKQLNFTDSAYDNQTNRIFLLSPSTKEIYYYDLARPSDQPKRLYGGERTINRLAASGGKVAAHYDNVSVTAAGPIAKYSEKHQLTPLIIDARSGNLIKTLSDFEPVTHLSIAKSGQYLAIKKKFENTLTLYNLKNNQTITLPSYDTGGISWQNDTLYLARDSALWSYDATNTQATLTKVAGLPAPVTTLFATTPLFASTNAGTTLSLVPTSQSGNPVPIKAPNRPANPYIYQAFPGESYPE